MRVHELHAQGKSIRQIAELTEHSRNTIRKYLRSREMPVAKPRPQRASKLLLFTADLQAWMDEGIFNCEVLLEKLQAKGYTGQRSILREFIRRFRPPKRPKAVMRFETGPGEQAQVDWGECKYKDVDGRDKRVYVFVFTLGYSRDQYVEFVTRADISTFLRCLIHALEYFGGCPLTMLFDNMKTVVLERNEDKAPVWHPLFAEFALTMGFRPRLCRARRPQTKGKVENGVRYV